MGLTRTLVINDLHIPFHDPRLVNLVLDVAEDILAPKDRIVINGDLLDFYSINMHGPKHPDVITTLEDELYAGKEFMVELRKRFPTQEIHFIFGNHEFRLDRFIVKHAKSFHNLLRIENMLELERLNITYQYYNSVYQLEDTSLYIQHSPPSYGVNGARTSLLAKLDASFIYGCTHRKQVACMTGFSGEVYTVYFNGWLGSTTLTDEHKRVFSYTKGHDNWQPAAILATVFDRKEFFIDQWDIKNNKVVVDGALYEG